MDGFVDSADFAATADSRGVCTGWQLIDLDTGKIAMRYNLYNNTNRTVAYNPETGRPEDAAFQDPESRISPQVHY